MKLLDAILYMALIILIVLGAIFLFYMKVKGTECIQDPIKYGISNMPGNISCSCFGDKGAVVSFSKDNLGNITIS